jgi:hypothetical protein
MCVKNNVCRIDVYECYCSAQRLLTGQVYEHADDECSFRDKRYHNNAVEFGFVPIKLPPRADDLLYQKVTDIGLGAKTCRICNKCVTTHPKVSLLGAEATVQEGLITSVAFMVDGCGDVFHEACLYSYLSEPSALNFVPCSQCEVVKAYVWVQGWNAQEIEAAMERVRDK